MPFALLTFWGHCDSFWCIASTVSFVFVGAFFCHKQVVGACQINSFFYCLSFPFWAALVPFWHSLPSKGCLCTHMHTQSKWIFEEISRLAICATVGVGLGLGYTCRWVTSSLHWDFGMMMWSSPGMGLLAVCYRALGLGKRFCKLTW